jgi:hypothetical protein
VPGPSGSEATKLLFREGLDSDPLYVRRVARWCARADAIFDIPGMHVVDVSEDDRGWLVVTVESDQVETGCPSCEAWRLAMAADPGRCTMRPAWVGSRWCDG